VTKTPRGTTSFPPPACAPAAIARLKALVLMVRPSPFAP